MSWNRALHAVLSCLLLASAGCRAAPERKSDREHPVEAGSLGPQRSDALRLLLVTDLNGVVEPCGCSTRSRGGLDRLAAAVHDARADGTPTLLLIAGHLFYAPSAAAGAALPVQEQLEAQAIAAALGRMRPDAVLPSRHDLALGAALIQRVHAARALPLLLPPLSAGAAPAPGSLSLRVGPRRIAVVGAVLDALEPAQSGRELAQLQADADAARAAGAQLVIALVSTDRPRPELERALARVDVAVLGAQREQAAWGHSAAPPFVWHAGHDGEQLKIVELSMAGATLALRSTRSVTLDDAHPRDPDEQQRLRELARKINHHNLSAAPVGRARDVGLYAGSEPCAACHTAAYLAWRSTAHARAFRTLQQLDKEYNLDCVGCHVTGFGRGGASLTELSGVADVGCESCHGPGAAHVENPQARASRPKRTVQPDGCIGCHDPAHSPEFDARGYRQRLDAPGHRVLSP